MSRKEGYNQYLQKLAAGRSGEPSARTQKRRLGREDELFQHDSEGKLQWVINPFSVVIVNDAKILFISEYCLFYCLWRFKLTITIEKYIFVKI